MTDEIKEVGVEPTSLVTTPSGIEIAYFVEDKETKTKRHYELRDQTRFDEEKQGIFKEDPSYGWQEAVSVTTAIEVLDKPLAWWGMQTGIAGTIAMVNMGLLRTFPTEIPGQQVLAMEQKMGAWTAVGMEDVQELLTKHKLTTNHVRDQGGDRGQSVHDALEAWAKNGILPDPDIFPPQERGYVEGLLQFLLDAALTPLESEVMVGSIEHSFAGRFDLRARAEQEREIVVHHTPVKGNQYGVLEPGVGIWDLKTSKDVYPSHVVQLEGYEVASVEDGYDPTDYRYVIHVDQNGRYKAVKSWALAEDWLAVLSVYHAFERMKERRKEQK